MGLMPRHITSHGGRTRDTILRAAADLASVEGLDGLSIGRLATELAMSKSGLFAHFGSKQDLQLATIEEARQRYAREVIAPALATAAGITRLHGLCEAFLSYVERGVFPGGCFFVAASAEVGAQAGRVHDEVARAQQQWRDLLAQEARTAAGKGELPDGTDPAQLAFELGVILAGTNIVSVLHDDHHAISRARTAIRTRLTG